jgi:pimeloyl-ACP methyl ester carboxylesterase
MAYVEHGIGGALVFLHGTLDSADSFRRLGRAVGLGRRVLALDLPGCGKSEALPDGRYSLANTARYLSAALEELGANRVTLCGYERGAALALFLALHDPQRIRALCLFGASFWNEGTALFALRAPLRWVAPPAVQRWAVRRALRPRYAARPAFFAERARRLWEQLDPLRLETHRRLSAQRDADEENELLERLSGLETPTMWMRGTRDPYSTKEESVRRQQACKQATLVELQGCGAAVHEEAPERVAEYLLSFSERHIG